MTKKKEPKDVRRLFHLDCQGMDEVLTFDYPDFNRGDDYDVFFISHNIMSWYSHQQPIGNYFRRMFKMIWCAIANKDYTFYEIVLDKKQFKEFKAWIRSL